MRAVIALLAIAVIAMGALVGFQAALADNASLSTVENETWTPDAGNVTTLNKSNLDAADYNETVTVRDSSGTVMSNETDYTWFDSNGTVKALTGGGLDGESEATISYGYERAPDAQVEMAQLMALIPNSAGALLPIIGLVFLLLLFKG
jgi:hypothetical protein